MRDALFDLLVRSYFLPRGKTRWASLLRRLLRPRHRLVPVRLGQYTVLADPADENDALYYFGIGGKVFPVLLGQYVRPGDLVVDVGANIGYFSLCALDRVGVEGKVVSFEANPSLGARLEEHFTAQSCPLELVKAAVWDEPGELEFFVATNTGWSSAAQNPSFETREVVAVPSVRLDQFFDERGDGQIRLLKVDVEGAELQALRGARGLLDAGRIDYVLFETGGPRRLAAFGSSGEQLAQTMSESGYRMVASIRDDRMHGPVPEGQIGQFNGDFLYARPGLEA